MKPAAEFFLRTAAGRFSVVEYGGSGKDCLLIHGTGQNALAWKAAAKDLARKYHVVALDLRGHGQTPEDSSEAQQYWRDIGPIASALNLERPVLIGHSTGAYAATAYVASGGDASAIVCVDGFTLDEPNSSDTATEQKKWNDAEALFSMFRYGWIATATERDRYLDEVVAASPTDPLNAGVEPELLRAMLKRCFFERDGFFLRRPTLEEIDIVSQSSPDATVAPDRDVYDRVSIPLLLVWARHGLSSGRHRELRQIAEARAGRALISIDASHNVPMQHPTELAKLICSGLEALVGTDRAVFSERARQG
ncbi:MAG: alpha/beta hydrolase [Rhizobiales bacterium]|nr:alpha/beta hydrolase [Hyphomicrobiales bacterium]